MSFGRGHYYRRRGLIFFASSPFVSQRSLPRQNIRRARTRAGETTGIVVSQDRFLPAGSLSEFEGEATNKAALITRTNEKQTGARIFPENARRREGTLYSKTTPLPRSSECISVAAVNHVQVGGFLRLSIFTCLPCERLTKQGILAPVHPKPANIFWRQSGSFEVHAAGRYVLNR